MSRFPVTLLATTAIALVALATPVLAAGTERVSVQGATEGNGASEHPAISADGRFIAFASDASNLVANDGNGRTDVFVHDRTTDVTTLVSRTRSGASGNGSSLNPAISANGRWVAFESIASDLVPGDAAGWYDVFLYDRQTGRMERVSVGLRGAEADGASFGASVSADGTMVSFVSDAGNLVARDANADFDVFVRDRTRRRTIQVNVGANGVRANGPSADFTSFGQRLTAISANGRVVAYHSDATNLVPGDTNGATDVFVRDLAAGRTERVSVAGRNTQARGGSTRPSISSDGRHVAFESSAANLVRGDRNGQDDVFIRDRTAGTTVRASVPAAGGQANDASFGAALAPDGRSVAFSSWAGNLVAGDTAGQLDVFLRDLQAGTTERASVTSAGAEAQGRSFRAALARGGIVAFTSTAGNLVPGDTNSTSDIFVRTR